MTIDKIERMFVEGNLPKGDGIFFAFNAAFDAMSNDQLVALAASNKGMHQKELAAGNYAKAEYHKYLGIRVHLRLKKLGLFRG